MVRFVGRHISEPVNIYFHGSIRYRDPAGILYLRRGEFQVFGTQRVLAQSAWWRVLPNTGENTVGE